jgi:hypothetical protein
MLLDTGADVSLVPRGAATELALPDEPEGRYRLLSFDGSPSLAPAFRLEMIFCDRVFRGRFLLIDQECGILGRNILNILPIFYDGPHLTWEPQKAVES